MSIESLTVVLNHSTAKGTAKLVLLGIANHDGDGGAYPSIETLARYASVDERNVQKAITRLVATGALEVEVQQGGDRATPDHQRTNRYRLKISCPAWCDRSSQHRDTRRLAGRQLSLLQRFHDRVAVAPPPTLTTGGGSATPPGGGSATQTVHETTTPPKPPPPLDPDEVARLQRAAVARARMGG